jgi:uncharacterized protein (TIGR00661 family)
MKIFYAVQATGNGHISRAVELLPYLQRYGTVDIFLSGNNADLPVNAPVRYRSKGLSLYYNATGGLDYWNILRRFHPFHLHKEINDLPVENYDLIINDFEFITAAACARKKIASIQLGHQASFQSDLTPRPVNRNRVGEWILKNYARSTHYLGLHFKAYDDFILPPVIKQDILDAEPVDKGHITVYLPSCARTYQEKIFQSFQHLPFHIFLKGIKQKTIKGNLTLVPVNRQLFNKSLIECHGIITGGGFETPAEALCLGKKIITVPTRGQYEQQCNAAALEQIGVRSIRQIDTSFGVILEEWLQTGGTPRFNYSNSIPRLIDRLFTIHESGKIQSVRMARGTIKYNSGRVLSA